MTPPQRVFARLSQGDMVQGFALLAALVIFTTSITWAGTAVGDSWQQVAALRGAALMLFSVWLGAVSVARDDTRETLAALMVVVLLIVPLEAPSYAASFAAVPLWWLTLQPLVSSAAFFGVGRLLARPARRLALLPVIALLLAPGLYGALLWLDTQLPEPRLNPSLLASHMSFTPLVVLAVVAAFTLAVTPRINPEESP